MKRRAIAAVLVMLLPVGGRAAELTLEVEGLDTGRLQGAALVVGVFTEATSWLRQPRYARRFALDAQAANGSVRFVLKDLPDGPLALSLFQDANANDRLDMNPSGIPTEPYGFSNNASARFGPPRFEQSVLTPAAGSTVKVRLN